MLDDPYHGCPLPKYYFDRAGLHPRAGTPRGLCEWVADRVGSQGGELSVWSFRYAEVRPALIWGHVMTSILPAAGADTLLELGLDRIFHVSTFGLAAAPPSSGAMVPSDAALRRCLLPIATAVAWFDLREVTGLDRAPTEDELSRAQAEVAEHVAPLRAEVSTVEVAPGPNPAERLLKALREASLLGYQSTPWPARLLCG
jgi:hypothetical protein